MGKVTYAQNLPAGDWNPSTCWSKTDRAGSGVAISGTAADRHLRRTASSARPRSLGSIEVAVIESGHGSRLVAARGSLVQHQVLLAKAKRRHPDLPTKKIKVTKKPSAQAVPSAGTTSVSPPPVAVVLESLAPSAEPALCPPTGTVRCEGNIIQAVGNFSAYTNKKAPIVAVLKFFYGLTVPKGTVYMLKPNGKTVDKLSACKKVGARTTPPVSTVPSRSSDRPPTTASMPRTPSTSRVPTPPWDGNRQPSADKVVELGAERSADRPPSPLSAEVGGTSDRTSRGRGGVEVPTGEGVDTTVLHVPA